MGSLPHPSPPPLSIRTRTHCVTERFEQYARLVVFRKARLCRIKRPFVNAIRLCSVGNETTYDHTQFLT